MKKIIFFILLLICYQAEGQELQAKLSVMANQLSTQVDKKIFQTLQTSLGNFLNNRKWTNETYQPH